MLSTTIALILATGTTPVTATTPPRGIGPITATYHPNRAVFCVRGGWNSASFALGRRVRPGDCRTAADWRRQGLAFEAPVTLQSERTKPTNASAQVAAR